MIGRLMVVAAGLTAGAIATWKLALEPTYRAWGVDADDASKPLAGDDAVPEATVVDTRRIEIAAPPATVFPWLVQMGYGRAGWYSYDRIDMAGHSVDRIHPEWQTLAVNDVVPTHPGGGFVVKTIEAERSLVLYLDGELVKEQAEKAAEAGHGLETAAPNVRAAGTAMGAGFPTDFAASWSFVLEPLEGGRTLLLERVRARLGEGTPVSRLVGPLMGYGVFLMTRKQMLGIRDRAEGRILPAPETAPLPQPPTASTGPAPAPTPA